MQPNQVTDFNTNLKQFLSLNFKQKKYQNIDLDLNFQYQPLFIAKITYFVLRLCLEHLPFFIGFNLPCRSVPPWWNRVKVSENLVATSVAPVTPVATSLTRILLIEIIPNLRLWKGLWGRERHTYSVAQKKPTPLYRREISYDNVVRA